MRYVLLAILGAILAFSVSLAIRLGAFKEVKIEISAEPEIHLIFKEHLGAYHKIVPMLEEVESWAKEHQVDCSKSFGEFLDDPDKVEEVRLRARAGCVVQQIPNNLPADIVTITKPPQKYIKATFEGSPSIGPFKVYAPVKRLAGEQRLKLAASTLEIYEIHGVDKKTSLMTTTYLFPVEN